MSSSKTLQSVFLVTLLVISLVYVVLEQPIQVAFLYMAQDNPPDNDSNHTTTSAINDTFRDIHISTVDVQQEVPTREILPSIPGLPRCPTIPPHLVGRLKVLLEVRDWKDIEKDIVVMDGGEYIPQECEAKDSVAIVVPFRKRKNHLKIFLNYIHPILKRQNIHYRVFVVSQDDEEMFNRAMLFNVGFIEALKFSSWDCFIFHDVDLLPEDDRNIYSCPEMPRHMSVAVDKFKYNLPYKDLFGGVSALSKEHFQLVNGFSNQFWGWGGEDDDMSRRLRDNKLKISRYRKDIAR